MCAYYIYIYAIYLYNIWNIHSIIQNKDKYFNYVYIYIYTHTHIYLSNVFGSDTWSEE